MNLEEIVRAIGPLDAAAMRLARERQAKLTKPAGSLGALAVSYTHLTLPTILRV